MSEDKVETQTLHPEGQTAEEVNDISIQQQQQLQAQADQIQTQAPSLAASMAYLTYAGGETGAQVLAGQPGQQMSMQQMIQPGMQYQTVSTPNQMWQMQMIPQTMDQSRMAQTMTAPQPEPSSQAAPIQSSMMEGFGIPASRIEPATQTYAFSAMQRPYGFQTSFMRGSGMGPGSGGSDENDDLDAILASTVNQRVERYDDGDNTWEGEDATDLPPGKHGAVIVTAGGRRYNILLVVHDSRVGSCYLLNRGETDPHASSKVNQIVVPNKYRAAVTYIHKLFISEFCNRTFAVQACEPDAPIFQGSTSTAAWTSALKYYCPQRQQPRLSGPLFFGFALKPIQDACPGLRYTARKKGNRGDRGIRHTAQMMPFDATMPGWFVGAVPGFGPMAGGGMQAMSTMPMMAGQDYQQMIQSMDPQQQQQFTFQQMQMNMLQQQQTQQQQQQQQQEGEAHSESTNAGEAASADVSVNPVATQEQPSGQQQNMLEGQNPANNGTSQSNNETGEEDKSNEQLQKELSTVQKRIPSKDEGEEDEISDESKRRRV
ncbi:uncharacterized protein MONOS_9732 [Monocercomonoides exilis]|uniref:uncharacterized protein n=1 Tax=Monocercomonoides exilis TaxID=2049356 RepID=UPI003559A9B6|nr:hypothetical protein MONOS_9732 [Monocercomonoides exilis]|eukprot:MONOS_9732.1-p1 / transcript=MONOS_9732.1 / gene=MONOS_9732 / organism=Monocercomonoides_exilis_PA203 / gene_product=unspecified product / transcript_product=unspecified product / location=Mono_scaffold00413:18602-20445(+) / protein_length=543 / sequence_SO=supercontig / SO=protein_coding / is_pseudo=false